MASSAVTALAQPDAGPWESRGESRHYPYSKARAFTGIDCPRMRSTASRMPDMNGIKPDALTDRSPLLDRWVDKPSAGIEWSKSDAVAALELESGARVGRSGDFEAETLDQIADLGHLLGIAGRQPTGTEPEGVF